MKTKLNLLLLFLITSCVGTIQDATQKLDDSSNLKKAVILFEGIAKATPTAHTKIRLSFRPATGGSEKFSYNIYQNGGRNPIAAVSLDEDNLDGDGFLNTTVDGLERGLKYTFMIRAYDVINEEEDNNLTELSASTLGYEVPLFDGIKDIQNVAGKSGENQLIVSWNKATAASISGDVFTQNPQAITGYNIYVGQSEASITFFGSVNDPEATSYLITGLNQDTNYFVRVRAKNAQDPSVEELNLESLQKRTAQEREIQFAGISKITLPKSSKGLSSFELEWSAGTGSYDRYLVFVSDSEKTFFDPSKDLPFDTITNLENLHYIVNSATAHTTYWVGVVACRDADCSQFQGQNKVLSITTTPPVAPFNGIKMISQPQGVEGLTSLDISWDLPDQSNGIYDQIKIFSADSKGSYGPGDEVIYYDVTKPSVIGKDLIMTTPTSTRIRGLTMGQTYCFIAEAYSTTPFDPKNPNGRSTNSRLPFCLTPNYQVPIFLGATGCSDTTTTSLAVNWSAPESGGLFSMYELYVKNGIDNFNLDDAIAGASGYQKVALSQDSNRYILTDLAPNSTYQIAVKTYFKDAANNVYRDYNTNVLNCHTDSIKVTHEGWDHLMAIGPKINGLTGETISEKMMMPQDAGFIHRIPVEDASSIPGITGSNQGMVYLRWNDFKLSDGSGQLYDKADLANTGYKVYRMAWTSAHNSLRPDISDANWKEISTILIPSQRNYNSGTGEETFFAEFTDYTVSQKSTADEINTYWYKVEAFINGIKVQLQVQPMDAVLKVFLPTNNMALVHRWMINKQVCSSMKKDIDRNHHYRCAFNGVGSTNGTYDYGGHYFMDRFELGCNFSRGLDTAKKCSTTTKGNAQWLGRTSSDAKGIQAGDCIGGSTSINGGGNAPTTTTQDLIGTSGLSVAFWRNTIGGCFINTTTGTGTTTQGATWKSVAALETSATKLSASVFPEQTSGVYPNGKGIAKIVATNNAKMPAIPADQYTANKLCHGFSIKFNGTTFFKRTPTMEEYFQTSYFDKLASSSLKKAIHTRSVKKSDDTIDTRACDFSNGGSYGTSSPSNVDFKNDNRYGSASIVNNQAASYSAGYISGSSGTDSTELCVSRFGVQDVLGSKNEWSSDQFACKTGYGCSAGYTDLDSSHPVTSFSPLSSESKLRLKNGDGSYYTFRSYDSMGPEVLAPATTVMYNRLGNKNLSVSYLSYYFRNQWMSPVNALPFSCTGNACNAQSDDNLLVTGLTADTQTNSHTQNFEFTNDEFQTLSYRSTNFSTEAINENIGMAMAGNNYGAPYFYTLGQSTGSNGVRCGVKLPEGANDEKIGVAITD